MITDQDTFDKYVLPITESGCYFWLGALNWKGYGRFRKHRAHRIAYMLEYGPIPEGLCVLHKCDIPCCVNPKHLFLGTAADNARDRSNKGRGGVGVGHLTDALVLQIRADTRHAATIAKVYNISRMQIDRIKRREQWKYI